MTAPVAALLAAMAIGTAERPGLIPHMLTRP